jgi:2-keto-3-deoxy-6-phosphogluconate aldolase
MVPVVTHPLLPEIRRAGVVAVLRSASVETAPRAVDAVVHGDVTAVDVTPRSRP